MKAAYIALGAAFVAIGSAFLAQAKPGEDDAGKARNMRFVAILFYLAAAAFFVAGALGLTGGGE